jgi:hypothetical protein
MIHYGHCAKCGERGLLSLVGWCPKCEARRTFHHWRQGQKDRAEFAETFGLSKLYSEYGTSKKPHFKEG